MKGIPEYRTYMIAVGIAAAVIAVIYFTGHRAGKNASKNPDTTSKKPAHGMGLLADPTKVQEPGVKT